MAAAASIREHSWAAARSSAASWYPGTPPPPVPTPCGGADTSRSRRWSLMTAGVGELDQHRCRIRVPDRRGDPTQMPAYRAGCGPAPGGGRARAPRRPGRSRRTGRRDGAAASTGAGRTSGRASVVYNGLPGLAGFGATSVRVANRRARGRVGFWRPRKRRPRRRRHVPRPDVHQQRVEPGGYRPRGSERPQLPGARRSRATSLRCAISARREAHDEPAVEHDLVLWAQVRSDWSGP